MPALTRNSKQLANGRRDTTIAVLAFGSASAGILLGGPPLWVALIALAWPLLAFVACNHLAGRGAVMVCLISGLAAAMGTGGASAWSAVGLLATIDLTALGAGLVADRMAPSVAKPAEPPMLAIPFPQQNTFIRAPRPTRRDLQLRPVRIDRSA